MNIEYLAAVGGIEWAWGDRVVRTGIHVIPPENFCAGVTGILIPELLPERLRLDQFLGLRPEPVLAVVSIIPAIAHNPVTVWKGSGEVGRLGTASDRRKDRIDQRQLIPLKKSLDTRGSASYQPCRQSDDV